MHISVLKKEVLDFLQPEDGEDFIDATLGGAGHTLAILNKENFNGRVLGIDADVKRVKDCSLRLKDFKERFIPVQGNFSCLKQIAEKNGFERIDGIVFDLGMSSYHLEDSKKGFSFQRNEPLDMRYDSSSELTAEEIVNNYLIQDIEKILKDYGQEIFYQKIAKEIVEMRKIKPIKTSSQLVEIVRKAIPNKKKSKINYATKTFQALRIAVNDELDNLEKALPQAIEILKPGGRIVVISFHSLEDRIVKNYFRDKVKKNILKIINKKPIIPQKKEIKINPRSRSAKLRAAIKI
jgi:16S rRNA (cytosine1402-N4)-methyltransferase